MRKHVLSLTERELRMILTWHDALEKAQDVLRPLETAALPSYDTPAKNRTLYMKLRAL